MELFSTGVYAFINEKLKLVYVGETSRGFLIRWIEHLDFENTWKNINKVKLLLDNDTEFKILKKINYNEGTFYFIGAERYYSEEYKKRGYTVINLYSNKIYPIKCYGLEYKEESCSDDILDSYKRCFKKIVIALAKKNNINISDVYMWSYNSISKQFGNSFYERQGKRIIDKLNLEELRYIVLKLYPKYKEFIIDSKKSFFNNLTQDELNELFYKEDKIKNTSEKTGSKWCILEIRDNLNKKSLILQKKLTSELTPEILIERLTEIDNGDNPNKYLGMLRGREYIFKHGIENFEFIYEITCSKERSSVYSRICKNAKNNGYTASSLY